LAHGDRVARAFGDVAEPLATLRAHEHAALVRLPMVPNIGVSGRRPRPISHAEGVAVLGLLAGVEHRLVRWAEHHLKLRPPGNPGRIVVPARRTAWPNHVAV